VLDLGPAGGAEHGQPEQDLPAKPGVQVRPAWHPPGGKPRVTHVELPDEPHVTTEFFIPLVVDYESTPDRSKSSFELFDLYIFSLFKYSRQDGERRWVLLHIFGFDIFVFSSGVGELAS